MKLKDKSEEEKRVVSKPSKLSLATDEMVDVT